MTPKRQQVLVTIDSTPDSVAPLTLALVLDAPARRGHPISGRFVAEGGTGGYVYAIIAGSLPSGTSMPDSATGELVGTPGTVGVAEFVARVQDSSSTVVDTSFAIDVGTSLSLPDPPQRTYGEVGLAFRMPLSALGATGSMSWVISSGNLHNGLTIAADPLGQVDEAVIGTPVAPGGNSRALLTGTDSGSGDTIQLLFETTVVEMLAVTGIDQMLAPVGTAVSTVIPITGGLPPYQLTHSGSDLPEGLQLIGGRRRSSYVIAGNALPPPLPGMNGNQDFLMTFVISDALGATDSFPVRITVIGQPNILKAMKAGVDVGSSAVRVDFQGTAVKDVTCNDERTRVTLTPQATATSVLGCSGAAGDAASIQATVDDRVLARVAGALSWTQVTAAMHATSGVTAATYTNATVTVNASGHVTAAASGAAPVTSVGLALPAIFSVTGSPVTTTGTLTATLATQSPNVVWAGPASGGAAAPAFRALTVDDLPNTLQRMLSAQAPAADTIANTAVSTTFATSYTIPAAALKAGCLVRVRAQGAYATAAAAPTLTLHLRVTGTTILTIGALTMPAGAPNPSAWFFEGDFFIPSIGPAVACRANGHAMFGVATNIVNNFIVMPQSTAVNQATNSNRVITLAAQWGTANVANTITLQQLSVEVLG